jgi:hypothetical protein
MLYAPRGYLTVASLSWFRYDVRENACRIAKFDAREQKRRSSTMKLASNTGMMLLGIWLILYGVVPLLKLDFDVSAVLQILAIAAGAFLLMNK